MIEENKPIMEILAVPAASVMHDLYTREVQGMCAMAMAVSVFDDLHALKIFTTEEFDELVKARDILCLHYNELITRINYRKHLLERIKDERGTESPVPDTAPGAAPSAGE